MLELPERKKKTTLTKLSKKPSALNFFGQLDNGNSSFI